MQKWRRREFIKAVASSFVSASMFSCSPKPEVKGRAILLGIDGLDPNIIEKLMAAGELPNFRKLQEEGSYRRLLTTNPPQSPVVWSSIATGANPGYHGIFDFIHRDPMSYLPELSLLRLNRRNITGSRESTFLPPRKGEAFWQIASSDGIPVSVIRWPVTFPASTLRGDSKMLAGLGVPDIKGYLGRYTFYTTGSALNGEEKKGDIIQLSKKGDLIETTITGPAVAKIGRAGDSKVPMIIRINSEKEKIIITVDGKDYEVSADHWSDWLRLSFNVGLGRRVRGVVRFYLLKVEPDLELYMTPVQVDARRPAFPISYPDEYAGELAENIGYYHTLGMPEDTNAFSDDCLTAEAFIQSCDTIMRERERMLWWETEQFRGGIFAFVFDTTDRIQHMFWRTRDKEHPFYDESFAVKYGNVIPDYYRRMDRILGRLLDYMDSKTLLMVISDHGFTSFRKAVHVNSWLAHNGFLSLNNTPSDKEDGALFKNVDWERTQAYAVGFTSIYVNIAGREKAGIVPQGSEAEEVKRKIAERLSKLEDLETGESVVNRVYDGRSLYKGPHVDESPDLVVGFCPGYRASWQTAIGGAPATIIEDNLRKWSGDHLMDARFVPGVLFMNRRTRIQKPTVLDIAPTLLRWFDIPFHKGMEGGPLL